MKKTFQTLLDDIIDDIIIYLFIATLIIFSVIAANFWPKYAIISIGIFTIIMFIAIYIYRKKQPKLNPFRKIK